VTAPVRPKLAGSVLELVGGTPLVRLNRIPKPGGAIVLAKLESLNPGGSVKDRIALAMVEDAERRGVLEAGATLVEPTSGNTGIGLAMVCAVRGYRLILTMPDDMSAERQRLLARFGAEIHLTPAIEGMTGAVFAAQEICREHPEYFMPMQFENPANPEAHRRTTALEILEATEERLDVFVAAVGTGGTITGVGQTLKPRLPNLKIVAVEPTDSAVLSGGQPGPHKIQGIGAGIIPAILDTKIYDEVVTVSNEDAINTARQAAHVEGIPVGISSGAALIAALRVAARPENKGKRIVVIIPSFAERYLSTPLFEGI
jgi:cysteine synthase A